jgi:hypothetical protein
MKNEHEVLINESNKFRINTYYRLNQLNSITGLSTRMLKYKMTEIKKKYGNVPKLLVKEGRQWRIHESLIYLFMPVKVRKCYNENNYTWQSFATWSTQLNYDTGYHLELINQIKRELPKNVIKYTIEQNRKGFNHVHFLCDTSAVEVKKAINKILYQYLEWYEVSIEVTDLINHYSGVSYTNKAPLTNGVI